MKKKKIKTPYRNLKYFDYHSWTSNPKESKGRKSLCLRKRDQDIIRILEYI